MFPLVGRACSSMLAWLEHWGMAARCAAEAGSRLCVGWLLRNRRTVGPPQVCAAAADGVGGDEGGEETRRRLRRRGNKAFMRVLEGLCVGGHLGMAQCLVDPDGGDHGDGGCCEWAAGIGLVWWDDDDECVVDNSLVDHVRDSDLLKGVCEKGHVEVAKWVVERFMVRETWEFVEPLSAAVSEGHLELAQWLVNTFDLVPKFSGCSWIDLQTGACKSGNVEVVKWCLETFPVKDKMRSYKILGYCLGGKSSKSVEVCQLIKNRISFPPELIPPFICIWNLAVLKWAMSAFPSTTAPTKENLERLCSGPEGVQFCQWLVEELSFTPTPSMFPSACRNSTDNVQTAKWLSTRVPLSPEVICDSFISSLANNNTSIASCVDLCTISCSIFVKLCKKLKPYCTRVGGMKWFLNHASMKGVDESVIVDCIEAWGNKPSSCTAILLMEHFHISEPKRSQLLVHILKQGVRHGTLSQIKKIVFMGEFSKEAVAKCLANSFGIESTKTAKWLINHFQLERQHITLDNNRMLLKLISGGKWSCAEWLINKFHITLDEFFHFKWEKDSFMWIDLFTWKMIQQVFPGLTGGMVKESFLPLVCQSPVIAQIAMKRFPQLTMDDILAICSSAAFYQFPLATRLCTDSTVLALLQQHERAASVSRAVSTSTIVWEWVLPWLLPESLVVVAPHPSDDTQVKLEHCVELCRIAEAMFPLVGRACSSILARWERWGMAARCAAEAGSRLCVGWLLRNRRSQPPCGGADGVGAAGADEDEETRRRGMRRRRGNKAFMRVLEGLCVGGHLGMAQSLVDPGGHGGDGCCGWAAGLGLVWLDGGECVVDDSLVDHVRASDLLKGVCEKGHVEVAKWVVERFMVRETWEFAEPLSAAVSGGHLELAQWLVNTFDLVSKFSGCSWIASPTDSCESENVEVVKWFLESDTTSVPRAHSRHDQREIAMKRFPQLTMDDILAFCSSAPRCQFPLSTHLWLRVHDPLIWRNS
ncbi:hypothetical protein Pelo_6910 [Pelomyxa schiedti]|nr:hypothetical protein Pelo_6910 [Pelomyxa schiedti]